MPVIVQQIIGTLHMPLYIITCLLICLVRHIVSLLYFPSFFQYWYELLNPKLSKKIVFLEKLKIPFAVAAILIVSIEIIGAVGRGIPSLDISATIFCSFAC